MAAASKMRASNSFRVSTFLFFSSTLTNKNVTESNSQIQTTLPR